MKYVLIMIVLIAVLVTGCACNQTAETVSDGQFLLDTWCSITLYGTNDPSILAEAFDLCEEYEALFSITIEGSDVWRINNAGGMPVTVSPQTAELIRSGLDFGVISGGLFDVTIGRVSRLWDFSGNASVPSGDLLSAAISTVDHRQVTIDGNTVRLYNHGAWIDLGGIAKGFIADRLADHLRDHGVSGAVIDLGGDIAVVGEKPDGSPWRIGVRRPYGGQNDLIGVIETRSASVVTSGIYERQFEENGVLYHHILHPWTGMPVDTDIISATVIADSAVAGDALSTIALLAGSEGASALLNQAPGFVGALLILRNGELLQIGDISFQPINGD